jgi:hypothetical protein
MNNWQLYNLLHLVANKDTYSNWLTPDQFELELISKNIRLMRNLLGLPERYQPGTMQAGASASRTIEIDLLPFLIGGDKPVAVPVADQVTDLSNWYYINDWYTSNSKAADIISQQELGMRINHPIKKATEKYPFATVSKKGLTVWPNTVKSIFISYYRSPASPVFKTKVNTTDNAGELEYDEAGSTELEWADHNKIDILYMIMQDMGINIERPDLEQLANKLVEGGK